MKRRKTKRDAAVLGTASLLAFACGGRPESFDAPIGEVTTAVGLTGSVALVDENLDRVVMLTATDNLGLDSVAFDVGKNVVATAQSHDQTRLFVLSNGIQPRRNPDDELPSLMVLGGSTEPELVRTYELDDPLGGLAVDPEGEWVVVFDAGGVVVNPNELILIKIDEPGFVPLTKTIRSFGGRPQRLTFTSELVVPNGAPRRMLVVETDRDVHLVDLQTLERDPITVVLPKTASGQTAKPAEIAFHDGDPADPSDARIAIRLENDPNVVLLELGPPPEDETDRPFKLTVNENDVVGIPSAIDFVATDGGLRLAALVPNNRIAALIDPRTGVTDVVNLPGAYARIARVTDDVAAPPDEGDVALLWFGNAGDGIAFWSLGRTTGTPFRSVEGFDTDVRITNVKNVPGPESTARRKILQGSGVQQFFVLDLNERTTFPMETPGEVGFDVRVSPDGLRAWAYRPGSPKLGSVNLETLHPTSLVIEREVLDVFDIERIGGGRSVIAVHNAGSTAATVMDAEAPDTAFTKFHTGFLLGGLR